MTKRNIFWFAPFSILVLVITSCSKTLKNNNTSDSGFINYIDTRIGTKPWSGKSTLSQAELPQGHVYPGVGLPFAMTQITPQTTTKDIPYWWENEKIQGFRSTHYPNGASMSEYGPLTIMPLVGELRTTPEDRASNFSHDSEIAQPHYYSVVLDDYDIKAELTAVSKAKFLQFTFPKSDASHIVIDNPEAHGYFRVNPEKNEIEGYTDNTGRAGNKGYTGREFASYFVAKFSKPFEDFALVAKPDLGRTIQLFPDGFRGEFYNNMELSGKPNLERIDSSIDFEWSGAPASTINADLFSVRYTGELIAKQSGQHTFYVTSDDGVRLYVNDTLVIDSWVNRGATTDDFSMNLKAGESYKIKIEYYDNYGGGTLKFGCAQPTSFNASKLMQMATNGAEASAVHVSFKTEADEKVQVKLGTSFINIAQARKNLESEINHWDFEKTSQATKEAWNKALEKIQIEGPEDQKKIFYTALQRSLLLPRNITEDGYHYSAFNGKVMPGIMYTDFSIWDTFRSEHPLLILLEPEKVSEMITALLNSYDEGGWMPKWPSPGYSNIMHGTHADAVVADAYIKGIRDYDSEKVFEAMLKNGTTPGTGHYVARVGILDYQKLGYVPTDKHGESAIRTLEFAYDDYCIAQMAKAMGKEAVYEEYIKRSLYYKNFLDPETKLVRGRNADGSWRSATDPSISGWAYGSDKDRENYFRNITLFAPHDVQGLANFMGGDKALEAYLDHFFENDFYYVGDEYSMHSPYLYNYIGAPWKTQKLIRTLLNENFSSGPGGLPGNEDCGQMSSWYIFGSMGFYPTCPGSPTYQIGSPMFDKVSLKLSNGKQFTIIAHNNLKENVYIQSATLDGKPYTKSWIHHDDIMAGSTLEFEMGPEPNKAWGTKLKDRHVSISKPLTN
ncbi:GH92 family glycosyl hydrolase [Seonamhaeicola aphaedonensis]|uniref:Putative alpha-1,2-mannosidase n=1 Tax=Seonamhaeicola aphaedonensis TaxID=1461338 RepID=A0A3D9HDE8_9FLAO|nr:GH92 family glycosyl hydrolase [Seonamhaeicola aphaedonensis]RED47483.1 putative alpha-1,2-mannosidase [Seonamhaeicola aphaedonensis]